MRLPWFFCSLCRVHSAALPQLSGHPNSPLAIHLLLPRHLPAGALPLRRWIYNMGCRLGETLPSLGSIVTNLTRRFLQCHDVAPAASPLELTTPLRPITPLLRVGLCASLLLANSSPSPGRSYASSRPLASPVPPSAPTFVQPLRYSKQATHSTRAFPDLSPTRLGCPAIPSCPAYPFAPSFVPVDSSSLPETLLSPYAFQVVPVECSHAAQWILCSPSLPAPHGSPQIRSPSNSLEPRPPLGLHSCILVRPRDPHLARPLSPDALLAIFVSPPPELGSTAVPTMPTKLTPVDHPCYVWTISIVTTDRARAPQVSFNPSF